MKENFTWYDALKFVINKYDPKDKKFGFEIINSIISRQNSGDLSIDEGKELWGLLWPKLLSYKNK